MVIKGETFSIIKHEHPSEALVVVSINAPPIIIIRARFYGGVPYPYSLSAPLIAVRLNKYKYSTFIYEVEYYYGRSYCYTSLHHSGYEKLKMSTFDILEPIWKGDQNLAKKYYESNQKKEYNWYYKRLTCIGFDLPLFVCLFCSLTLALICLRFMDKLSFLEFF